MSHVEWNNDKKYKLNKYKIKKLKSYYLAQVIIHCSTSKLLNGKYFKNDGCFIVFNCFKMFLGKTSNSMIKRKIDNSYDDSS